ncbi:MAG: hypothetical protein GX856_11680 [Gammaproteobacteria bacterium]|jgi:hypothetical protein|nr:hypothetical protein [Gammaproteobacteria bacterium]
MTGTARRPRPTLRRAFAVVAASLLAAACPPGPARADVTAPRGYLERMDTDGDGRVSLDEYLEWMGYAFHAMDRNGDGVLDAAELPGGRGRAVTLEQHRARLSAGFARQDANGDGHLDAAELASPPR